MKVVDQHKNLEEPTERREAKTARRVVYRDSNVARSLSRPQDVAE